MGTTVSLTQLEGRRVVAADDATQIGQVKHLVLSPDARNVEAIHVAGKKQHADIVGWADISSIGSDAVMITSGTAARQPESDLDAEFVRGDVVIVGARVLDTEGYDIGTVANLEFDVESGAIVAVTTSNGSIDANRIRSLGTFALVVDPVI
jgi:uncharacterized protein YrrD